MQIHMYLLGSGGYDGIRRAVRGKGVKVMTVMTGKNTKLCSVTDTQIRTKLSSNPEFVCERCGTTAHSKTTLCDPVPIEPDH